MIMTLKTHLRGNLAVLCLLLANAIAFGVLSSSAPAMALGVDGCDESVLTGCDCGPAIEPWVGAGCFNNHGDRLHCKDETGCRDDCTTTGRGLPEAPIGLVDSHKMRRDRRAPLSTRWMLAGLGCLLAAQVTSGVIRATRDVAYEPLRVDAELPFTVSGWQPYSGTDGKAPGARCHMAFICHTDCGACSALAERHASQAMPTPKGVRALWLLPGDSAHVASWADERGLPRERVLALKGKRGPFWRPVIRGDVWFTPTRVVLTPGLVVKDARPSDALLDQAELQRLCEDGGFAPQGVEELRDLIGGT